MGRARPIPAVLAELHDRGGGGDLAESALVSGSRVAVVEVVSGSERHEVVAALDVAHVAQEHDTRR